MDNGKTQKGLLVTLIFFKIILFFYIQYACFCKQKVTYVCVCTVCLYFGTVMMVLSGLGAVLWTT